MLKIVPDPPPTSTLCPQTLEDYLVQASHYLSCATAVAEQSASLNPKPPATLLLLVTLHEIQHAQTLVEAALTHVQTTH